MSSIHNAAMPELDAAAASAPRADDAAAAPTPPSRIAILPGDDDLPLTRWIVTHRVHIFAFAALMYLLAFNGEWRVGRDSSFYRGLAHSLATGHGYHFGEFGSRQIYPGLPVLLAGLEKVFGGRDLPPILLIHLFSLGCLIATYKLLRLRFPQWVAVAVTACAAINSWYLELTNEVRDDVPFLFAMMLALYGWERLRIAVEEKRARVAPIVILLIGLALAAVMRPTFWILAIAWLIVCGWGFIAGPHRKFYATCLGLLLAVWVAVAVIIATNPSFSSFSPFRGGYERDAADSIRNAGVKVAHNLPQMLREELAYGFFGQKWFPGGTQIINLALIGSSLLLLRRNPMWTLLILGTVAVTLLMRPVPRYYVMVAPLMALSWLLLIVAIARRVPAKHFELIVLLGLLMVVIPNVARNCKVIAEQRKHQRSVHGTKWGAVADMSRRIAELVPPGDRVVGPWGSIMSYLSGREVLASRDILPLNKTEPHWPTHIAALGIKYAVFPATLYDEEERRIRELMDKGVIVPTARVARVGEEWVLQEVRIDVPPSGQDWRKRPVSNAPRVTVKTTASGTKRPPPKVLHKRHKAQVAARREAADRKMKAEARVRKQQALVRAERKAAAERAAAKARKKRIAARKNKPTAPTQPTSLLAPSPGTPGEGWGEGSRRERDLANEHQPRRTSTLPSPGVPGEGDEDVGGFSGQSLALRSASICWSVNLREPALMPWQRWPAASQRSLSASSPSQNGQVRHWSGRTS
jgi:hypothetical protein